MDRLTVMLLFGQPGRIVQTIKVRDIFLINSSAEGLEQNILLTANFNLALF